jgi:hypothetical protein
VDEWTSEAHLGFHQRAVFLHAGESAGQVAEQAE